MKESFVSDLAISSSSWASFERIILRILFLKGFKNCSVVGMSGDGGADVLGLHNGRRWLFQAKALSTPVGLSVVRETIAACHKYDADIPVIVSKSGFTADVYSHQRKLVGEGVKLQLWDRQRLQQIVSSLEIAPPVVATPDLYPLRRYQLEAVERIVASRIDNRSGSALVVLATGLGKTWVAGEAIRRMRVANEKVLVLAHTVDLVQQLERSFWPFISSSDKTCLIADRDRPSSWRDLESFDFVFATRDSIDSAQRMGNPLPTFDFVVVDEAHHLGAETYERVLDELRIGQVDGPFLLGMTATPWRPDGTDLSFRFSEPVVNVDLTRGLRDGYLANVDYRMYTDNVNWDALIAASEGSMTPKQINRTLFITEWDDAVIERTREAWDELGSGARGIVFCGTIEHAEKIAARVNALGFTNAVALHSGTVMGQSKKLTPVQRNKILWDFADGRVGLICAVDILNEGVDVPDVNLVVFQRVTHSRRIFTQQLGRGLRLAPGKEKVLVLDFVTDVRRFAAGLQIENALRNPRSRSRRGVNIQLGSKITFFQQNNEDVEGHRFLHEWLKDIDEIEAAGDDVSILKFPLAD